VQTRQGGGSTVQDFRQHAGLDLLPRLLVGGAGLDLRVVRDVVETRSRLGPQVVEMAAARGAAAQDDRRLGEAAAAIRLAGDNRDRQRAALAFWDVVVDRGGSIVFRLLYNQLRAAFEPALDAMADLLAVETDEPDRFEAIAAAIVAGDTDAASRAASELLGLGEAALLAALDDLGPVDDREPATD
jgi:DNA-binding FadR family transcriptional regulator